MERLTFVDEDGLVLFDSPAGFPEDIGFTIRELAENEEWEALDNIAQGLANCEQRLKYYEDLEEQGKLLKLPCAVGDRIYRIDTDEKLESRDIEICDINNIVILSDETILLKYDAYDGVICEIENIVTDKPYLDFYRCFLTKSAAEQSLKEVEANDE